ncbi:MAG: hypothetical protein ACXVX8_13580 [Blastococcus sp.]
MENEHTAPEPPEAGPLFQLKDELRLVDEEIEQARRAAEEFRSRIGERAEVQERTRTFPGTGR